jgi:hypothetical protein
MFYCLPEGTTKRKELHGTTGVRALSGTWASEKTVVKLQSYKLKFSCDQVGKTYSDFVLLIDTTIANEAANLYIDLYLHDKMVKASVSPNGLLELSVQQVCSSLPYGLATFVYPSLLLSNSKDSFCFSRLDGASEAISSTYVQWLVRKVVHWIKIVRRSEGVYS